MQHSSKLSSTLTLVLGGLLLGCLAIPSQAAIIIPSSLDINGDGVLVNGSGIDWVPINLPSPAIPPTTTGNFAYQGPTHTGSFANATNASSLGTIRDLPAGLGSGVLGLNSLQNLLVFNASYGFALNTANFVLEELFTGNIGPNNPIQLTQLGSNVNASIGGRGRIIEANGDVTAFTISFTTQFTNTTVAQVIAAGSTPGGIQSSWSGTLSAGIPEPATYVMMAAGLGLLGFVRRRA